MIQRFVLSIVGIKATAGVETVAVIRVLVWAFFMDGVVQGILVLQFST